MLLPLRNLASGKLRLGAMVQHELQMAMIIDHLQQSRQMAWQHEYQAVSAPSPPASVRRRTDQSSSGSPDQLHGFRPASASMRTTPLAASKSVQPAMPASTCAFSATSSRNRVSASTDGDDPGAGRARRRRRPYFCSTSQRRRRWCGARPAGRISTPPTKMRIDALGGTKAPGRFCGR